MTDTTIVPGVIYGYQTTITLDDIISHAKLRSLADEPIGHGGLILWDIMAHRIGHKHDLHPEDILFQAGDSIYYGRDTLANDHRWECEAHWMTEVDLDAEAEQAQADLDNDDRWLMDRGLL